jgi:16S rRNA processing protein RimM
VNTHGARGEFRLLPYAFPCPTLRPGVVISLAKVGEPPRSYTVERARPHRPFVLVKLKGVESMTQAETLCDTVVSVPEDQLPPLRDGEFYHYQVIGLAVRTTAGDPVGTVTQVFFSGGHDVWVVRRGDKEFLIPVTEEIVRQIDIPGKQAVIDPPEGLLE